MVAVVVLPRYVKVFSPNGFMAGEYERMYSMYEHSMVKLFRVGCKTAK